MLRPLCSQPQGPWGQDVGFNLKFHKLFLQINLSACSETAAKCRTTYARALTRLRGGSHPGWRSPPTLVWWQLKQKFQRKKISQGGTHSRNKTVCRSGPQPVNSFCAKGVKLPNDHSVSFFGAYIGIFHNKAIVREKSTLLKLKHFKTTKAF